MPAPASETCSSRSPVWIGLLGALGGMVAFLLFLPWDVLLRPGPRAFFRSTWVFLLVYGTPTAISGFFGALAALWSWCWMQQSVQPFLAQYASWAPLRGRWLLIAVVVGQAGLLWAGFWTALFTPLFLLALPRLLEPVPLDINLPLATIAVAGSAVALGCLGPPRSDRYFPHGSSRNTPVPLASDSENRTGNFLPEYAEENAAVQQANFLPSHPVPRWVTLGGLLFGVVIFVSLFPDLFDLRPRSFLGPFGSRSGLLIFVLPPLGLSGGLGLLSARWSWNCATKLQPLLARSHSWTPLRGRWLVFAITILLIPLGWFGFPLTLYVLARLVGYSPMAVPIILAFLVFALGLLGASLKRRPGAATPDAKEPNEEKPLAV